MVIGHVRRKYQFASFLLFLHPNINAFLIFLWIINTFADLPHMTFIPNMGLNFCNSGPLRLDFGTRLDFELFDSKTLIALLLMCYIYFGQNIREVVKKRICNGQDDRGGGGQPPRP